MLSWIFKKRGAPAIPVPPAQPVPAKAPGSSGRPAGPASVAARLVAAPVQDWGLQLSTARGDDAALLQLAQSAAPLQVKLDAVEALAGEAALKQAERAFRSHDRKVHRRAKQRLDEAVTRREARARARRLLERAHALLDQPLLPVNHVVDLDRDWQALPAQALEPEQGAEFAELRGRLDSLLRERGEAQQHLQRWTVEARRFLPEVRSGLRAAAEHGCANDATRLGAALEALRAQRPEGPASAELAAALLALQQSAAQLADHLAGFELAQAAPVALAAPAAPLPSEAADPEVAPPAAALAPAAEPEASSIVDVPEAGPASPAVEPVVPVVPLDPAAPVRPPVPEPIADAELRRLFDQRQAQWLQAHRPAPPERALKLPKPESPPRKGLSEARHAEQQQRLEGLLQTAEAALAEGHFGALEQQLQTIDHLLATHRLALPEGLRARHQALRAERGRLKDWQQWGGARARDDLVAEADVLARQTLAAADPALPNPPKLNLKQLADSIQALRLRWRELDRSGAAASLAQWQAFDGALQAAHQPVAAQHAVLQAARQDNLQAREALLAELDTQPLPEEGQPGNEAATHWRDAIRALDRFQQAWRKLGPVEHTVPAASRKSLEQRSQAALARIEGPLRQARDAAATQRQQLIARAEELARQGSDGRAMPDAARQLRELQATWQDHARQLPLTRAVENDLWTRFKAATDAVFELRHASFAARDAELAAQRAAREALLLRLSALDAASALDEITRTLAEVDRAWRHEGELPRGAGDALETRFRAARAAAAGLLSDAQRRHWEAQCERLAAALRRCEEREDAGDPSASTDAPASAVDTAADAAGGDEVPASSLPAAWARALAQRRTAPLEPGPLPASEVDELLLHLETALNLPAAPEWQAARQQLKLRALKEAMEGRGPARSAAPQPADQLLAMLGQRRLDPTQRERLHRFIAALRAAAAGARNWLTA